MNGISIFFFLLYAVSCSHTFLFCNQGGIKPSTWSGGSQDLLWMKFIASADDASVMLFPFVFGYSVTGMTVLITYAMMVGLIAVSAYSTYHIK